MFCTNCGMNNPDNAAHCTQCGKALTAPVRQTAAPVQPETAPENFKDFKTINILITVFSCLCCCSGCLAIVSLVLGIVGIVFSSQAKTAFAAGDYATAQSKAKTAKIMAIIGGILLIIVAVVNVFQFFFSTLPMLIGGGGVVGAGLLEAMSAGDFEEILEELAWIIEEMMYEMGLM